MRFRPLFLSLSLSARFLGRFNEGRMSLCGILAHSLSFSLFLSKPRSEFMNDTFYQWMHLQWCAISWNGDCKTGRFGILACVAHCMDSVHRDSQQSELILHGKATHTTNQRNNTEKFVRGDRWTVCAHCTHTICWMWIAHFCHLIFKRIYFARE